MSGSECSDLEIPPSCTDGSVKEDAENCYIFNVCVNGQYQKASCPIGYYFYAPSAACKLITYDANYKCNCVVPDHTLMANRYNCETFYLCEGREAILEHCSLGAYYNSTINACLTDVEGICLMQPTTSPVLQVKTELEKLVKTGSKSICEYFANSEISFHPYEDDCRKFFLCINGQVHVQQCPKNFYYDSTKNYCVLDTENRCQNAEPTDVEETNQDMDIETSLIAKTKSLNYIPVQNKLFARFMKY